MEPEGLVRPEKCSKSTGVVVDDNLRIIELLTQATCYLFKSDQTRPGVVVSYLPDKNYYVSIVRYQSAFAKNKEVVFKTRHPELSVAINRAAHWVTNHKARDPVGLLEDFLDGEGDHEMAEENVEKVTGDLA